MTELPNPSNRKRVDIKSILKDPVLSKDLINGATDFICKIAGVRAEGDRG